MTRHKIQNLLASMIYIFVWIPVSMIIFSIKTIIRTARMLTKKRCVAPCLLR